MLNNDTTTTTSTTLSTVTTTTITSSTDDDLNAFKALQYALFITCFIEVIGGLFFLINALFIVEDREKVERAIHGKFRVTARSFTVDGAL